MMFSMVSSHLAKYNTVILKKSRKLVVGTITFAIDQAIPTVFTSEFLKGNCFKEVQSAFCFC